MPGPAERLRAASRALLLLFVVLLAGAPLAHGAACTVSVSGLSAAYVPSNGSATTVTGTVTVYCAPLAGLGAYNIAFSPGGSGSFAIRKMTKGTFTLNYQLYTDSAMTMVWGDGTAGTNTVSGIDNLPLLGGTTNIPIYMKITALQNDAAGTYNDTIPSVTVSY